MPLIAINKGFFTSPFSSYHDRVLTYDVVAQAAVKWQHLFFYPLMCFARWNLYFQGWCVLVASPLVRRRVLEGGCILGFFAWLLLLTTFVGGPAGARGEFANMWLQRSLFLIVSHSIAGVLHVQIVLSHFSRDIFEGRPLDKKGETFLSSQLATCMDIETTPALDFLHGGLQFQTTHHLFPRLPSHRLRGLVPEVRALAKKFGFEYKTDTFVAANIQMMNTLQTAAKESSLFDAGIWEGFNAVG
jgi:fatty acid desaturase